MKLFIIDNETTAYGAIEYIRHYNIECCIVALNFSSANKIKNISDEKVIEIYNSDLFIVRERGFFNSLKLSRLYNKLNFFTRARRYFNKLICELEIDELFVSNDRSYGTGFLFPAIKAATNVNIPVSVVEFADFADEQRLYAVREKSGNNRSVSLITKLLFPQYILKNKNKPEIEMYNSFKLIYLMLHGCLNRNPKIVGSMKGVRVLVRNSATAKRLISNGCDKSRVIMIDDFFIDNKIVSSKDIDISFAFPQLFEHDLCSKREANEIHREICEVLSNISSVIKVLLHPKMNINEYQWIQEEYGLKIFEGSSYDAIQRSRVFISTYSSLTHDAIKHCCYPHIYDPLELNYDWLSMYESVSTSKNPEELTSFLLKLNL